MPKKKSALQPVNPLQVPRFGGILTFSRLPWVPNPKECQMDVAIVGVPFDGGTTYRPGARFAPRSIREASVLCRNFNPHHGIHVYQKLQVADIGDVACNPLNINKTFTAIETQIASLQKDRVKTVTLGGDHSILLPELRAAHAVHGEITLIHFDAHTDTADQAWGEKLHHGTPIRRAIEEGILNPKKIFQIGIRGPLTSPDQEDYSIEQGIRTLDIDTFQDTKKRDAFFKQIHKTAGKGPCWLTFDIDSIDPAYAPGTGTPVIGGLTSLQALQAVRALAGLNIVGADLMEVAPAYDHAEITSLLAAGLIFEFLSLMAVAKK